MTVAAGQTNLRLGRHALDLPPDVAAIVYDHLAQINERRNEAGHPEQQWLFPGLQPGQPLHVFSAAGMLKEIGLPARAARNTAWRQMVQQAPAAILADGLCAQRWTAARHAKIAGADYASYPSAGPQHRGTLGGSEHQAVHHRRDQTSPGCPVAATRWRGQPKQCCLACASAAMSLRLSGHGPG